MVRYWEHLKLKIRNWIGTPKEAEILLSKIVLDTISVLKLGGSNWSQTYVPKRTGALQKDLIKYINTNWIYTEGMIVLDLISNIPYAMDIVGNPIHVGTFYEHDGSFAYDQHGKLVYLNDPQAEKYWWQLIVEWVLREWDFMLRVNTNHEVGL